jgi:CRISPR-associated protein Csd1
MSWIQKLYETYELAAVRMDVEDEAALLPISHVTQQAHIQITLDGEGNFKRAEIVSKENTLVPATEDSAGRSSGGAPHPLNDKIQYVAGDYTKFKGRKNSYFDDFASGKETKDGYLTQLKKWHNTFPNPKLKAVLKYVSKRTVVEDLVKAGVLHVDEHGELLTSWESSKEPPAIFKLLTKKKEKEETIQDQGDAFVRWCVNLDGVHEAQTWTDEELIKSWIEYDSRLQASRGMCFATGEEQSLGVKHPARLRHGGDKAKLISSNDTKGFTYLGRFTDSEQACSVGYETSQKAHNALRWLIQRQAFRNDDQVVVAWEVSGKKVPPPVANSKEAFFNEDDSLEIQIGGAYDDGADYKGDFGQSYVRKLNAKIAGYHKELGSSKDIVVMGLDSATPGRMAITYYRELTGSEFLERLEAWHKNFAWFQNYSKDVKFVGAPAPKEIAEAAFGRRLDAKISKMTVNRLLPCIVDGTAFPQDLVRSTHNRAVNRMGMEHWEWEKVLGIACALFNGVNKGGYQMALEPERTSRDYLYGRLLAVAERLEYIALNVAGEKRDTNAAKLMQRFAERPYSTWLQIEQALSPYKTRLQTQRAGFLTNMKNLLDDIHCMFKTEDYVDDKALSGEFLLGYHCQRHGLKSKSKDQNEEEENSTNMDEEDN